MWCSKELETFNTGQEIQLQNIILELPTRINNLPHLKDAQYIITPT
jgi:hypothetical protein